VHLERRILIVQAVKPLLEFFLIGAIRRMHRHADLSFREVDQWQSHGMRARGQRVVRVRVP
jgi:hypothetical protein